MRQNIHQIWCDWESVCQAASTSLSDTNVWINVSRFLFTTSVHSIGVVHFDYNISSGQQIEQWNPEYMGTQWNGSFFCVPFCCLNKQLILYQHIKSVKQQESSLVGLHSTKIIHWPCVWGKTGLLTIFDYSEDGRLKYPDTRNLMISTLLSAHRVEKKNVDFCKWSNSVWRARNFDCPDAEEGTNTTTILKTHIPLNLKNLARHSI